MLLDGKVALITGAANGIGRAVSLAAAREGASLVLGDTDEPAGYALQERLCGEGVPAYFQPCDVSRFADLEALARLADEKLGAVDVAFANAGIEGHPGMPWDCREVDFQRVVDVNLTGSWRTMAAVLPGMVARGSGAIVATASVAGLVGAGGLAAYVASKHGILGLVKSVAIDVARSGVRVNAVCPGMIETNMVGRLSESVPGFRDALLALKPMARLGAPQEVAELAVWLASERASFMTGAGVTVDGGFTAQ